MNKCNARFCDICLMDNRKVDHTGDVIALIEAIVAAFLFTSIVAMFV